MHADVHTIVPMSLYYRGSYVTFTCARRDVEEEGKGEGNGGEGWDEGMEARKGGRCGSKHHFTG